MIRLRLGLGGCGRWGGFDGCWLGFGAVGRSGACRHTRRCPSAFALLGFFWVGFGVTFRDGGWLGSGQRWATARGDLWRFVGLDRPLVDSASGRVRCRRLGWGGCARCWGGRERCWRAAWARPREYSPLGLGGGVAGWGVERVMLCGAPHPRGAVGAAAVCASTLVGLRGCACALDWAWGVVPQAPSFSPRLLEGFLQVFEDIRVVLGCREVVGVNSVGMERIRKHGFPCGLGHPPPRRLEAAVLRRPPAGPVDQALEGGLCPGPLSQLPELRVGPALPPLSMGGAGAPYGGRCTH